MPDESIPQQLSSAQRRPTRRSAKDVRPFIGTSGDGHTTPGAHQPFGMMTLSPVNLDPESANRLGAYSSGYQRKDGKFRGIAHTALSGAGIVLGQDIVVSPFEHPASIDRQREFASAGYYSATIVDDRNHVSAQQLIYRQIRAREAARSKVKPPPSPPPPPAPPREPPREVALEVAAGVRYGVHRYAFSANTQPVLYLKLTHGRLVPPYERVSQEHTWPRSRSRTGHRSAYHFRRRAGVAAGGEEPFVARCAVDGHQKSTVGGNWASYDIFFYAEFNAPCNLTRDAASWTARGAFSLRMDFGGPHPRRLEMHIAISYVSQRGARLNFAHERTSWSGIRAAATAAWEEALGTVVVEHTTSREKTIFDTALYHAFTAPYVHSDADGRFLGPDGLIHRADGFTYYSFLSTWDTYRAWGPLMCRLMPHVMLDLVRTGLRHFEIVGVLPRWTWAGKETSCMPGHHSLTLLWQAVAHGLTTPALDGQIYAAFRANANASSAFMAGWGGRRVNKEMGEIMRNDGVLYAFEGNAQTVSESLEYAIMSHCVSLMAARVRGTPVDAGDAADVSERFRRLAHVYERLWDPARGYFGGMRRNGVRLSVGKEGQADGPFHSSSSGLWTEGSAIQWLFHVMHDFPGLLKLVGRETLLDRMHTLFTRNGTSNVVDTTGTIGMYAQGNEPSHHIIFWYFLLGKPEEAERHLSTVLRMYTTDDDGIIGNDDAGALSAWYVCAMLGFYPVDPTNATMLHFRPRVQRVVRVGPHPRASTQG